VHQECSCLKPRDVQQTAAATIVCLPHCAIVEAVGVSDGDNFSLATQTLHRVKFGAASLVCLWCVLHAGSAHAQQRLHLPANLHSQPSERCPMGRIRRGRWRRMQADTQPACWASRTGLEPVTMGPVQTMLRFTLGDQARPKTNAEPTCQLPETLQVQEVPHDAHWAVVAGPALVCALHRYRLLEIHSSGCRTALGGSCRCSSLL